MDIAQCRSNAHNAQGIELRHAACPSWCPHDVVFAASSTNGSMHTQQPMVADTGINVHVVGGRRSGADALIAAVLDRVAGPHTQTVSASLAAGLTGPKSTGSAHHARCCSFMGQVFWL